MRQSALINGFDEKQNEMKCLWERRLSSEQKVMLIVRRLNGEGCLLRGEMTMRMLFCLVNGQMKDITSAKRLTKEISVNEKTFHQLSFDWTNDLNHLLGLFVEENTSTWINRRRRKVKKGILISWCSSKIVKWVAKKSRLVAENSSNEQLIIGAFLTFEEPGHCSHMEKRSCCTTITTISSNRRTITHRRNKQRMLDESITCKQLFDVRNACFTQLEKEISLKKDKRSVIISVE